MMPRAHTPALALALAVAAAAAAPPAALAPGESSAGFAQALAPREFAFPGDHGPHPQFRHEWWYLTGNLQSQSGARFGFELTFFRFALKPPPAGETRAAPAAGAADTTASAWRAREVYMAHFAVTDVSAREFRFAQKLSRAALGLAGAHSLPLDVWIDDWSLRALPPATPGEAGRAWRLTAAQAGYAIELTLLPETPPILNGDAGLSRKSAEPEAASYYYSLPRLQVHGRLIREGEPLPVGGLAWFDHEWGSGGLGARQAGWDWYALEFEDGSALMFYALRDRDGTRDRYSAGTWIEPGGRARRLGSEEVALEVSGHWTNTQGTRYPSGWRLHVPALALEATVRPVLEAQELRTTPPYWEGAVDVRGVRAGRNISGRGYVELVGYAQER